MKTEENIKKENTLFLFKPTNSSGPRIKGVNLIPMAKDQPKAANPFLFLIQK